MMPQSIKKFMLLFALNGAAIAHAAEHRLPQATPPPIAVTISQTDSHFKQDQPTCKKVAAQLWQDNKKTILCLGGVLTAALIVTAVRLTPDSKDTSSLSSDQSLNVFSTSQDELNKQLDQRARMPRAFPGKKAQQLLNLPRLKQNNRSYRKNFR